MLKNQTKRITIAHLNKLFGASEEYNFITETLTDRVFTCPLAVFNKNDNRRDYECRISIYGLTLSTRVIYRKTLTELYDYFKKALACGLFNYGACCDIETKQLSNSCVLPIVEQPVTEHKQVTEENFQQYQDYYHCTYGIDVCYTKHGNEIPSYAIVPIYGNPLKKQEIYTASNPEIMINSLDELLKEGLLNNGSLCDIETKAIRTYCPIPDVFTERFETLQAYYYDNFKIQLTFNFDYKGKRNFYAVVPTYPQGYKFTSYFFGDTLDEIIAILTNILNNGLLNFGASYEISCEISCDICNYQSCPIPMSCDIYALHSIQSSKYASMIDECLNLIVETYGKKRENLTLDYIKILFDEIDWSEYRRYSRYCYFTELRELLLDRKAMLIDLGFEFDSPCVPDTNTLLDSAINDLKAKQNKFGVTLRNVVINHSVSVDVYATPNPNTVKFLGTIDIRVNSTQELEWSVTYDRKRTVINKVDNDAENALYRLLSRHKQVSYLLGLE